MSKNIFEKKKKNQKKKNLWKWKIKLSQIFRRFLLSRNSECSVHKWIDKYSQLGYLLWGKQSFLIELASLLCSSLITSIIILIIRLICRPISCHTFHISTSKMLPQLDCEMKLFKYLNVSSNKLWVSSKKVKHNIQLLITKLKIQSKNFNLIFLKVLQL